MRSVYLLLGQEGDLCCAGVSDRLAARGLPVRVAATPLESPALFVWRLDDGGPTTTLVLDDHPVQIAGVLVRGMPWVDPEGWAAEDHLYMQAEMLATTLAWLAGLTCPVINRPSAAMWYRGRNSLIAWRPLLRRCELPVPDQIVTNDPVEARSFADRLAADRVDGVVYAPLTGSVGYLVATDDAWEGLAKVQERSPVSLIEPHGAARPACIIGEEVFWDDSPSPEALDMEPRLRRLAALSGLDFLEVVTAPFRRHLGVVAVEPMPVLEHFTSPAADRILDALTARLMSTAAEREAVP